MANGKSDGSVRINTLVDTKGFGRGVNTMQKQIGGLSGAIGKLGLAITAAFGIGKLIQFGKEAVNTASDLQEVQNVVDVVFTTMSKNVDEFAKNAAHAAGLSEIMAKRYMGTFGAMASSFGFMEEEAFNMSASLTQAVGDVASFYNITQDEAYTKLKSVFTGETESLKDLGVVMTQSALDAYAMANGYGKTTSAMSEQEKVALRYAFVLDRLSASSGDFVRSSDSWANLMRSLNLSLETFKANVGQALINVFTPLLKIINQLVAGLAELSAGFVAFSRLITGRGASGGGSPGDALEDIAGGYGDITDATNEAAKAQKNYTNNLDELNILSKDAGASTSTGGFGISGGEIFEEIANDEELDGPLVKLANRIKEIFADENWTGLGKLMSDGIILGLNTLSDKIKNVDWNKIGRKIGQFLKDVDWAGIIVSVGNFLETLIDAAIELWKGAFDANPIGTIVVSALALPSLFKKITSATIIRGFSKLAKAVDVTKDSFWALRTGITDGNFLTGLKLSIDNIRDSLSGMQKAVIGVIAVAAEFTTISSVVGDMVKGSEELSSGIMKIVGAAGLASTALYTAFGSAGLAVGAITGLVSAIMGANEALSDIEDMELYGDSLDVLTEKVNNTTDAVNGRIESSREYVEDAGLAETKMAQDLAERYFALAEKEELTNQEKEEMKNLSSALVNTLPELEEYYNAETGLIDATRESIDSLIQSRLQEIKLSAVEDELKEAYAAQLEAVDNLNDALEIASASQEKMNELQAEYDKYAEKLDLVQKYNDLAIQISSATGDTSALLEESEKLWDEITNGGQNPDLANYDYLVGKMGEAASEINRFSEKYNEAMQSLQDATASYEMVEKTIQDYSDILASGMEEAANNSVAGYADGLMNNEDAQNASYELAREILDSFAEGQDSHSPSREFAKLAKDSIDGYNLGIAENKKSTLTIITEYVDSIKKKVFDMQNVIVSSFANAFLGISNSATTSFNSVLSGLETMINSSLGALANMVSTLNQIPSANVSFNPSALMIPKIPYLAKGAVIPPNAPFMAMLGDQRHGTNLEAPEDLIRQIVREEAGGGRELIPYFEELIKYSKETAEKDLIIGDRDIAKANARGSRSLGYPLIT